MLVRNPVDRAYSHYQHEVRLAREKRSFEAAFDAETMQLGDEDGQSGQVSNRSDERTPQYSYQEVGLYIDQLERWETLFPRENLAVLQSEDLFERPAATLNEVFEFLDVPKLELPCYERFNHDSTPEMDPVVRFRLTDFFEPYNQRLYLHLGKDLGWEDGL